MDKFIDIIIPSGSKELVQAVIQNSSIPVIKPSLGVCHIYVDEDASLAKATEIIINAKQQSPSASNAVATVLLHEKLLNDYLPALGKALLDCEIIPYGCDKCCAASDLITSSVADNNQDCLELSIKSVPNLQEATNHISQYNTRTESFIR